MDVHFGKARRDRRPPGSGFRVTILGRAGSYPAPGEPTTGLLLSTETTHVLLDCGSGVLANLLRVLPAEALDAVVLTHLHPDHTSDLTVLPHLVRFGVWRDSGVAEPRPLPLYLPPRPTDRLAGIPVDPSLDRRYYLAGEVLTIGDLRFTFRQAAHAIYACAVRVEHAGARFVFTGDTAQDPGVTALASGADLLLCEATLPDDRAELARRSGHMTPSGVAQMAVKAGVDRVLLTHFLAGYDAGELVARARAQALAIAGERAPRIEPAQVLRTYQVVERGGGLLPAVEKG